MDGTCLIFQCKVNLSYAKVALNGAAVVNLTLR